MIQTGSGSTRERILVEASRLFASRGYHGTSTRDIAQVVGIRQPSLYNHFSSKESILATLLDADLVRATGRVDKVLAMEGPAAARLHAYLQADIAAVLTLSYDVRGLYNDVVLELPELRTQAQRRSAIHDGTARLVAQGVESGDLDVDLDPEFVQHAITGLLLEAVRQRGSQPAGGSEERALAIADFVLRATLAVPSDLPRIRAVAGSLVAALDPGVAGQSLLAPGQAH